MIKEATEIGVAVATLVVGAAAWAVTSPLGEVRSRRLTHNFLVDRFLPVADMVISLAESADNLLSTHLPPLTSGCTFGEPVE